MRVGYPDTMNKKGPSPLKVRYTTSGDKEDIVEVGAGLKKGSLSGGGGDDPKIPDTEG